MSKTPEQRKNLELALELWKQRVKPEQVELRCWGACFGHYVGIWPEFRAQGVGLNSEGVPFLRYGMEHFGSTQTSRILFGTPRLFHGRGYLEQECRDRELGNLTDYELVIHRLETELALS